MMQIKDLIIARYKIRQELLKLKVEIRGLKKLEDLADKHITFEGLKLEDMTEANKFKKLNIDNLREGVFNQKPKDDSRIKLLITKYK